MPMVIKFNPRHLEASIRNIAEKASSNASRTLRRTAVRIRDLARAYAPADTGTLERAIEYAVTQEGRRNVFTVYVDLDRMHPDGRGKTVGDYAWIMEGQLHPYGRQVPGAPYYNLRDTSKNGPKVGGRFLSRAVKDGSTHALSDADVAVKRTLSGTRVIDMGGIQVGEK